MVEEDVARVFQGGLMSPLDRDYIEQLVKLGYKEDARSKLDEFYSSSKKGYDTLFTPEEKECFEALVKEDQVDEAERALELAYHKRKDVDQNGLSPMDREYIEMLEKLGEKDVAKEVRKKASGLVPTAAPSNSSSLLTGIDKEYVDALVRLGKREKARKVVDSIYSERKDKEQSLMMDLLDRARKR